MAKTLKNMDQTPRKPTAVTQKTAKRQSKNRPVSVYLRADQREYMENLAAELKVSGHSLRQFAITYFINQHRAGQVQIKTEAESTKKIIM